MCVYTVCSLFVCVCVCVCLEITTAKVREPFCWVGKFLFINKCHFSLKQKLLFKSEKQNMDWTLCDSGVKLLEMTSDQMLDWTHGTDACICYLVLCLSLILGLDLNLSVCVCVAAECQRKGPSAWWQGRLAESTGSLCLCVFLLCILEAFSQNYSI